MIIQANSFERIVLTDLTLRKAEAVIPWISNYSASYLGRVGVNVMVAGDDQTWNINLFNPTANAITVPLGYTVIYK